MGQMLLYHANTLEWKHRRLKQPYHISHAQGLFLLSYYIILYYILFYYIKKKTRSITCLLLDLTQMRNDCSIPTTTNMLSNKCASIVQI